MMPIPSQHPGVVTSDRVGSGIDFSDPNGPLARYFLQTSHVVAVAFVGLVFVVASYFPLWHTDVWGHVKYGQWMVQNRAIPDREPFCPWWDGRIPFTQFYTLSQLTMYGAYATGAATAGGDELTQLAGGIEGLRFLHATLTALRFAVLLLVFWRLGGSWPLAIMGGIGVLLLDLSNLAVFRPQTFAQLLFAILLWPLSREVISRRAQVLIPVLLAVWVNTHGSYIMALVLITLVVVGRSIQSWIDRREWPWQDQSVRRLASTLILALVAAALCNPYGPELFKRTLDLASHPSLLTGVGEWKPLAFEWGRGWHWVFMISLVVIGLTQLASPRGFPVPALLLLLAFGVGVALQMRFVIWWAMIVPWVLVARWSELRHLWPQSLTPSPSVATLRKTGFAILLGWAICMWSGPAGWLTAGTPLPAAEGVSGGTPWQIGHQLKHPEDPEAVSYPELAEVIRTRYPEGRFTGSVMATPMQGDYLMWALAPDIPVTYAHLHLFHPNYWEELGKVGRGAPGWWDVLDKYRVNLLVMEADYAENLKEKLIASGQWLIVLDETDDPAKPNPLTRQFIAARLTPR